MRKLIPPRSWRFILGMSAILIGLGSFAFSQLVEDSPDESPPPLPGGVAAPFPAGTSTTSADGSAADRIKALRDDLVTARRALAKAKQDQSESDRRAKAQLDRLSKDLDRSKEELRLARRVIADNDPNRVTELTRLQGQVDNALAQLKVKEQTWAREQVDATRKLQSLNEELEASEGIFADSLADVAKPDEALPAVTLLQENLKRTHDDIVSSLNDSSRREQDVLRAVQGLESTVIAAQREITVAREISRNTGGDKKLEAESLRNNLSDALENVTELQKSLDATGRLQPEIGELNLDGTGKKGGALRPDEIIRQLQNEVDSSQGLQASLNEDVDKLRTELKQAFRQILSMQMKLEESNKLVSDLERQRESLLQSRNEGISGVEGMNRLVLRLEQELGTSKSELKQIRDSLNAEKVKSAAIINSLSSDLESSKADLLRVKALANVEGRDAVSMLELEEELNRTKAQLLAIQRQNIESGSGSEELKTELKKAFGEVMRLRAELTGKEDLERQLANLEKVVSKPGMPEGAGASAEYLNELIRSLNATKLALNQAQSDQDQVRLSLSREVADLDDKLQQSRDELDSAQVDMARKELEFSDLVKGLENELAVTQEALRQAADAHNQGSDVIEIMDQDLGAVENRMQQITAEMQKERMDAAKHIRDLQVELQASRRRQEIVLGEIREKDETLASKDAELLRARAQSTELQEQLKEVDAMGRTLSELNTVLRSTESVQNVNVDQANALAAQLRDELEQAKVEALLAKQTKEDVERRANTRVSTLEKQLRDTQNQLELSKGQFHDVTGEGAELIAELKSKLGQAQVEISLLKQAGAGETVGTEKLAVQLQEAIATIQVLQHNLTESEKVNSEVDDLRLRLATVMEAKISDKEREDADTDSLRKKMRTLEMELALANQAQSSDRVNAQQLFSNLKDELEASRNKVAALQQRMGQTDAGSVETIATLEEELARSKAEQSDAERRLHQLVQGKTETVAALERELVLTKTKIDQLEQNALGLEPSQSRIAALEQQLAVAKAQLDQHSSPDGAGDAASARATELEKQLVDTQKRLNELLLDVQNGTSGDASPQVISQLQAQLQEAHSAVTNLQGALAQRDKENTEIETQLEKALENMMDMQMAGDGTVLRKELDDLKRQLAAAKSAAPGSENIVPNAAALADLQLEIEKLKTELQVARQDQPVDQSQALGSLQEEINQLKKDLSQARQAPPLVSAEETKLQVELESATEKIFDLQTQVEASKKKIQDMNDLAAAQEAGDNDTVAELSEKLQKAMDAILDLKAEASKSETAIAKGKDDASVLDQELKTSFQSMQKLKDEKNGLTNENKTLNDRIAALEDMNSKLTAASRAALHSTEVDQQTKLERDNLIRTNLSLQTDLEKYKNEWRRLQERLASPSTSGSNAANLQAQVTALESQIQIAKAAENSALNDFDQVSANLRNALRQVRILETNLGQAEGKITQLEASSPTFGGVPSLNSGENITTKALRDEVINLRAQLEVAQAAGSSRSQIENRLRDTSRKLLTSKGELERANQRVAILEDQANQKEARRRSDVEREKAANQMVTLLNEKLKREEAKSLALQEGLRKLREVIATLRGEPGSSSSEPGISSGVRPSMFDDSLRPVRFPPRTTVRSSSPPLETSTFPGVRPRAIPSRATFRDRRSTTESTLPRVEESVPSFRPSTPVGRTVIRGNAQVDFQARVQFLDKQIKPASNVEFFLTKGLDIEDIIARAGISLPPGIDSAAELWARSIHRGYSYPGVAAKIRDALSAASVGRFKTDASGESRLGNLTAGRYTVIGASPMGLIGVVWSEPVDMSNGARVVLDLRNSAFAK